MRRVQPDFFPFSWSAQVPVVLASKLGWVWAKGLWRPFWVALIGMVVVSAVALTGQILARAVAMPDAAGVLTIWLCLLPEMLGVLIPVALLFASVSNARQWDLGGDFQALSSSGVTTRSLLPVNFALGSLVALAVAVCTHGLGPMGRAEVREVLVESFQSLEPVPGQAIEVGDVWLRVDGERAVVASEEWVAWSQRAQWASEQSIDLERGQAMALDGDWEIRFEGATVPVNQPKTTVHNFERSHAQMWALIRAMEAAGEDASRERLTVYKRSTLAALAPLMLLLGLPMGAIWKRPALVTLLVVLSAWTLQRLGDHAAVTVGPSGVALLPLVLLSSFAWLLWVRWRAA